MAADSINFQNATARLVGLVRGGDEAGHYVFELHLPPFPILYGEYRPRWADNQNDFDVDIVSFGFRSKDNVGNPNAGARQRFASEQRAVLETLITALFARPEARKGKPPFAAAEDHFLGHVRFVSGWIITCHK
jgi:hypothetical protein